MKTYHIAVTLLLLIITGNAHAQLDNFNKYATEVLSKYVSNGVVDYKKLSNNPTALNEVINALESTEPASLKGNEKKAFLINAYNILVIHAIVQKYPTKSVMKIAGFFDRYKHKIGESSYTLNELEKDVLFKEFNDPRLHFALVCGAVSCPPLGSKPFTATGLESELKTITRRALNSERIILLDMHEKTVTVSKLFDWYKQDFKTSGNIIDYINAFRSDKIPSGITIAYANYSWELNGH